MYSRVCRRRVILLLLLLLLFFGLAALLSFGLLGVLRGHLVGDELDEELVALVEHALVLLLRAELEQGRDRHIIPVCELFRTAT